MLGTSIIGLCALFVGKRTRQSAEWYAKILSFRDTVALAGHDQLAELVKKDPAYFYHTLPYAYVLDIPERWAANFESIAMEAPAWYIGMRGGGFSSTAFTDGLSRAMNAIMGAMTSVSSSHGGAGGDGISTITCE
jgi:hypothetical protein